LSPRAAWRLETLGFAQVFDYADGKLDWIAAGLPTDGTNATKPRAGDLARKDTPTCHLTERLSEVRDRVRGLGWDAVVVVNEERIVLGLLRSKELDSEGDQLIEQVMRPGPSTFPAVRVDHRDGRLPRRAQARQLSDHDIGRPAGRSPLA